MSVASPRIKNTRGRTNQATLFAKLFRIAEGKFTERLFGVFVLIAQDLIVLNFLFWQRWDGIYYPLIPAEAWEYLTFYVGPFVMILGSVLILLKVRGGIVLLLVPVIFGAPLVIYGFIQTFIYFATGSYFPPTR